MSNQALLTDDEYVAHLQKSVSDGSRDFERVTSLVAKVLESGAWGSFKDQLGMDVEHESFQSFVTTPRWKGLGTSKDALVAWTREQDTGVSDLVERAWRGEIPAARKTAGRPSESEANSSATVINRESADSILARLKRDDPALAEQVVNGEVTPNAAALAKGWRKPRVLLTNPEHVASKIYDHWSGDQIAELIELLQEGA